MLDCLNNYIGLRGFCSEDQVPISGLYINDISGISLKQLDYLSNEEQKNYKGIWDEIYRRSLHELESDVSIITNKYFNQNLIIDTQFTGIYCQPYKTIPSTNDLKGNTIETLYEESRYLAIHINNVQLYLSGTVTNENIFVYNFLNGKLIDSIPFSGEEGINTIEIDKSYKTYGQDTKLFVCYNSTISDTIKTTSIDNSSISITRGAKIAIGQQVIENNMDFTSDSAGLIVNYNLICDICEFVCTSKQLFKMPLLYKLASNVFFENLTSDRFNKYTLLKSKEEIKDLHDEYEEMYMIQLSNIVKNLTPDNFCYTCSRKRNYNYLRP